MNRKKKIKIIIGLIPACWFIFLFIWGPLLDKKCKERLNSKETKIELVFVDSSRRKLFGGGIEVRAWYSTDIDNKRNIFSNSLFMEPVPKGLPIFIKYSLIDNSCYKFLIDSIVNYNDHIIKYERNKNYGYVYSIENLNIK